LVKNFSEGGPLDPHHSVALLFHDQPLTSPAGLPHTASLSLGRKRAEVVPEGELDDGTSGTMLIQIFFQLVESYNPSESPVLVA
jgi:hypothetical protein